MRKLRWWLVVNDMVDKYMRGPIVICQGGWFNSLGISMNID
jgi:hypothetical protein